MQTEHKSIKCKTRNIQKEVEDRLAGMIISDYRKFYSFAKIDSDGETLSVHCM